MLTRFAGATLVAMVAAGAPGSAWAQTAAASPPPASAAPAQPAPLPVAGWNDGFFLQTPDGQNRLQIGAVVQTDGRFSVDDPLPITNTFTVRKVRTSFSGRIGRFFDFRVMPEFAGSVVLLDGYFDIRFSPGFRLRSGKDKTPIGYELLIGDPWLVFPERSLASQLVPNRDVGFQAQGDLAGGRVIYSGGIFNGSTVDGTSGTTDVDTNNGKDFAGRVVFQPYRLAKGSRLANFGVHIGASTGSQTGALPAYRTSIGQAFFAYAAGTAADGDRHRFTPAVFLYTGRFGGFAEYVRTSAAVTRAGTRSTVAHQAWDVTATYVLTGEPTSDRGVRPRAPFDPSAGQWGALQAVARYGELTVDDDVFAAGLAAPNASRRARQVTFGANWYPHAYVKVYATYEHFTFDGGRDAENSILFRTQLAF